MAGSHLLEAKGEESRSTLHQLKVLEEFRYVHILGYGRTGYALIKFDRSLLLCSNQNGSTNLYTPGCSDYVPHRLATLLNTATYDLGHCN